MSTPAPDETGPEPAAPGPVPLLRRPIPPRVLLLALVLVLLGAAGWYGWSGAQADARKARVRRLIQESKGNLENLDAADRQWLDQATGGRAALVMRLYVPPAPASRPQ